MTNFSKACRSARPSACLLKRITGNRYASLSDDRHEACLPGLENNSAAFGGNGRYFRRNRCVRFALGRALQGSVGRQKKHGATLKWRRYEIQTALGWSLRCRGPGCVLVMQGCAFHIEREAFLSCLKLARDIDEGRLTPDGDDIEMHYKATPDVIPRRISSNAERLVFNYADGR